MAVISPQIRCYLPLTGEVARELHEQGSLSGDLIGFVVTESVRRSDPDGDEEVWEWAALQDAAAYCREQGQPVLVAAADVARDTIDDTSPTGSRVAVHGPIALPRVASLHLGDELVGGAPDEDAATESAGESSVGESSVGGEGGVIELSWYDATELAEVLTLL